MLDLRSKEAIIHDIVRNYAAGCSKIVGTLAVQHAKEIQALVEEQRKCSSRYLEVCEDVRRKVALLSNNLQDMEISQTEDYAEEDPLLARLRHLRAKFAA